MECRTPGNPVGTRSQTRSRHDLHIHCLRRAHRIVAHGRIITEESPTRFVYECSDLFGCHRWTLTLQPRGNGTRLTQRMERIEGPWWVRLLQPCLMWPIVGRRSVGKGLANSKTHLESGSYLS